MASPFPENQNSQMAGIEYNEPWNHSPPPVPHGDLSKAYTISADDVAKSAEQHAMVFSSISHGARHVNGTKSISKSPVWTAPVVVLVHGAWHRPAHYFPLLHGLTAAGFMNLCPQLPTGCSSIPPHSLVDDTSMIRSLTSGLADRGHPIIVIMHSYGGVVGTEALAGLGWYARQQDQTHDGHHQSTATQTGGVIALIYMTAFLLPLGWSLATPFGNKLPPFMTEHPDGTCSMNEPYHRFYSTDLHSSESQSPQNKPWLSTNPTLTTPDFLLNLLTPSPTSAQTTPLTRAAYLDTGISITYIVCENDVAIAPEAQRRMIQMARSSGVDVREESCQAGHSPFLSVPGDVAGIVQRTWARWVEEERR